MSCTTCNKNAEFSPLQDTWKRQSSLNPTRWQPYPEFNTPPPKKENYQYALNNGCNNSINGPPLTNGYRITDQQPLKKENYQYALLGNTCNGSMDNTPLKKENYSPPSCTFHYSNINNTWNSQQPYTL